MRVQPVAINWHPGLPIFAKESFLKAVSDEYGWLGGWADSGELRCLLPYTIIRKAIFRMVRFRVETISMVRDFDVSEEKDFLSGAVGYFRSIGADMIIPATTNTIFRAFPDGAEAAPYGSYVIDLSQAEDVLWKNINRITRQNINAAAKNGVVIKDYTGPLEEAHVLIRETFRRSKLPFMDFASFRRFMSGLGENGKLLIADHRGTAQSFVVFAFSDYCAYAIYAGNAADQQPGANKLLYWEAIRSFRGRGVHLYDFVGARIDPEKGSKQEALASLKRHFGATLKRGYMWKYPFHPLKYRLYGLATRFRSGGDIVDAERHKLDGSGAGNS
jgi:hypothetical protein